MSGFWGRGLEGRWRLRLRRLKRRLLVELDRPSNFAKTDLIHLLSARFSLQNYLELCTATTGNYYREIDKSHFKTARRVMYRCPSRFGDGLPIDFRIPDFNIGHAMSRLKRDHNRIDICLVDGWHTYDCAIRDLRSAYDLLASGGALVVHDCLPPNAATASSEPKDGEWCGVSYRAFLDFVLDRKDLDYCTVDVDYGCGVIFKDRNIRSSNDFVPAHDPKLIAQWFDIHNNDADAFSFFMKNRTHLLRLISAKTFLRNVALRAVVPASNDAQSSWDEAA